MSSALTLRGKYQDQNMAANVLNLSGIEDFDGIYIGGGGFADADGELKEMKDLLASFENIIKSDEGSNTKILKLPKVEKMIRKGAANPRPYYIPARSRHDIGSNNNNIIYDENKHRNPNIIPTNLFSNTTFSLHNEEGLEKNDRSSKWNTSTHTVLDQRVKGEKEDVSRLNNSSSNSRININTTNGNDDNNNHIFQSKVELSTTRAQEMTSNNRYNSSNSSSNINTTTTTTATTIIDNNNTTATTDNNNRNYNNNNNNNNNRNDTNNATTTATTTANNNDDGDINAITTTNNDGDETNDNRYHNNNANHIDHIDHIDNNSNNENNSNDNNNDNNNENNNDNYNNDDNNNTNNNSNNNNNNSKHPILAELNAQLGNPISPIFAKHSNNIMRSPDLNYDTKASIQVDLQQLKSAITELQHKNNDATDEILGLKVERDLFRDQLQDKSTSLYFAEEELEALKGKYNQTTATFDRQLAETLEHQRQQGDANVNKLSAESSSFRKKLESKEREYKHLSGKYDDAQNSILELSKRIQELELQREPEKIMDLKAKLTELKSELTRKEDELNRLNEELRNLNKLNQKLIENPQPKSTTNDSKAVITHSHSHENVSYYMYNGSLCVAKGESQHSSRGWYLSMYVVMQCAILVLLLTTCYFYFESTSSHSNGKPKKRLTS